MVSLRSDLAIMRHLESSRRRKEADGTGCFARRIRLLISPATGPGRFLSKLVEMRNGAWALARFTVRSERTVEMPGPLSFRTLKRRERRAPHLARCPYPVARSSIGRLLEARSARPRLVILALRERASIFLFFAFFSVFSGRLSASDTDSTLGAWLNAQTNIQTWSAEVVQTRALKSLTQPLTATGHVWFAAPNRFHWELGNPPQTIAVRDAGQMLVIYPKLKRAEKYPLTGEQTGQWRDTLALLEAGFPRSQSELESRFRLIAQTTSNNVHE